jgi:hypothetical protein
MLDVVEKLNGLAQSISFECEKAHGETIVENDIESMDELDLIAILLVSSSHDKAHKSNFSYLFTDILFKPLLKSPPPR